MIESIKIDAPVLGAAVNAADFGMNIANEDNYDALTNAIVYCKENNAGVLVIPNGVYKFTTPKSIELTGLCDFVLDGNGSEFVFSNHVHYFRIKDCLRTEVKNLFIDWDWNKERLGTLGKVVEFEDGKYFDMEFFEVDELADGIPLASMNEYDPITLTPGTEGGVEIWLADLPYKKIDSNLLRFDISGHMSLKIETGKIFLARHYLYGTQAFVVADSQHVKFDNVVIYSVPGMGWHIEGDSQYIGVVNCKIMLRPGCNRRVTATADGIHVCQSLGFILIENCDFSFMGDDCVNIHDNNTVMLEKTSPNTARCRRNAKVMSGDTMEFRRMDLYPTGLTAKTVEVKQLSNHLFPDNAPENQIEITFEKEIPDGSHILFNKRYDSGNYVIRNNYFHENRARGILVHNSNGLIENNRFYKNQGAAIQMETGAQYTSWSEGTCIDGLTVRGNIFDTCDVNDWNKGVIYISVYLPNGRTPYPAFKNIDICNNEFINVPRRIAIITSAQYINFKNNTIKNPDSRKDNNSDRSTFLIEYAGDVVINDNVFEPSQYISDNLFDIDAGTTYDIDVQ